MSLEILQQWMAQLLFRMPQVQLFLIMLLLRKREKAHVLRVQKRKVSEKDRKEVPRPIYLQSEKLL